MLIINPINIRIEFSDEWTFSIPFFRLVKLKLWEYAPSSIGIYTKKEPNMCMHSKVHSGRIKNTNGWFQMIHLYFFYWLSLIFSLFRALFKYVCSAAAHFAFSQIQFSSIALQGPLLRTMFNFEYILFASIHMFKRGEEEDREARRKRKNEHIIANRRCPKIANNVKI